jgi:uncharacterized protein involved in cysteine biosynthesis
MLGIVFLSILVPPLIEPLLGQLPDWMVWLMLAYLGLMLLRLLVGRGIWNNMIGTPLANLVAALVVGVIRLPFRMVRALFGRP